MNIYELILAGLQTKFAGADTATLQRIASIKSNGVTDASLVQAIVDAVTFMDVMKNYGDRRSDDASKTAVNTYETKYNIKDGKPVENPTPQPTPTPTPAPTPQPTPQPTPAPQPTPQSPQDMASVIAAAISQGLKPLSERLDRMEQANVQSAFDAKVDAVAKMFGIPEFAYKGRTIDHNADLNVYFTDLKQTMINQGYKFPTAPQGGTGAEDKPGQTFADWTKEGTQALTTPKNQ